MALTYWGENNKSLDFILNWYDDQKAALKDFQIKVIEEVRLGVLTVEIKFNELSIAEITDYFEQSFEELEHLASFNFLSFVEASLRIDFVNKVKKKEKSELARKYREITKHKKNKVSLEQDIIETLKELLPSKRRIFSDYTGALNYRHWIAHGRYWNPKLGRS